MNVELIHDYLSRHSYWAEGRSLKQVRGRIEHSFCIGAYIQNKQIGFTRVMTDYYTNGWIFEAFVLLTYQGKGIGKKIMTYLLRHPQIKSILKLKLKTKDAHKLYLSLGFKIESSEIDTLVLKK